MILHHRDYELSEDNIHVTLCGENLNPPNSVLLVLDEQGSCIESLAFSWCPIERITCDTCRNLREGLETLGEWPE